MLCVTVSGCRPRLIIGWISLAMAFNGFCYSGYNVTHVDMSPYFASTLFGLTSTIAFICGIFAPSLVGFLTADKETIPEWNRVFYTIAFTYVLAGTFFDLFASAEKQPWGLEEEDKNCQMSLMTQKSPQ
ncbi:sialin [Trichonephila clavata]|uniref:Sialin n=1 Tax=Trichonephila clavata TaxID=2740835 RepID=A0A8X6KT56_TRICU|nr:sialin [Trichonephila clavata]